MTETIIEILKLLGVGSLIGVLVGHWLGRRSSRKDWTVDNKKQEYRELLDALNHWYDIELPRIAVLIGGGFVVEQGKDQEARFRVALSVNRLLKDRLFIGEELRKSGLFEEWGTVERLASDPSNLSVAGFEQAFNKLHDRIVSLAKLDTGIS